MKILKPKTIDFEDKKDDMNCSIDLKKNENLVEIRAVFLKIGEIDTLNETFYAEVFIEAVWLLENLNKSYDCETDWNPKIYIANCLGELKEKIWYDQFSIKDYHKELTQFKKCETGTIIVERRKIAGKFWQTLDLKNFPVDVQKLTIIISTPKQNNEFTLIHSKEKESSVDTKCFADSQEWSLYRHITVKEFLRDSDFSKEKFPTVALTLNAARHPNYYFCNTFLLVFLITISGLSTFSIRVDLQQHRIQTTCTLILTSVTFKWITNRSLPTVSYMTSLDKYSLTCILYLVVSLMWHSIIGQTTISVKDSSYLPLATYYDQVSFLMFFCLFFAIHLIYLFWLVIFGYAKRRELDKEEKKYTESLNENKNRSTRLKSMLYGI